MKKIIKHLSIVLLGTFIIISCENSLDLYPLSEASSETWYSNETEIQMALNDFYRNTFWAYEFDEGSVTFSDDAINRNKVSNVKAGTITSEWETSKEFWKNAYKTIARINRALEALNDPNVTADILPDRLKIYIAEARFHRAYQYSTLITRFGDVVYSDNVITLEEAYSIGRTDKMAVLQKIYEDFDVASNDLPIENNSSGVLRVTKGAALAFKARIALYMADYGTAAGAAEDCMDLDVYSLHSDYRNLFLQNTKNSSEKIFVQPRSVEYEITWRRTRDIMSRTAGGFGADGPSWDLMCSYLCTDGMPIDESPLYNPQEPFKNRDPRLTANIVEFETEHLDYIYDPNPYSTQILKVSTGQMVSNQDTRSVKYWAAFNGILWRKYIDNTWDKNVKSANDIIHMRYADVLLMYAEAKIELGQIDESVLDALNMIRARAYKVDYTDQSAYPAITETEQSKLRSILRIERRMELACEGLRLRDLIRWGLAEDALTRPIYGMLDPDDLKAKVIDQGLWFFPGTPEVDENGLSDFSAMASTGLIKKLVDTNWDNRQYLWPIPSEEIQINENMEQNPGY